MKDVHNSFLQLAEDIYAGKCDYQKAISRIDKIEKRFGKSERNLSYPKYPEKVSQEYLEELIGRVRVGLYSKSLVMDLARAVEALYGVQKRKSRIKTALLIGTVIAVVILLCGIIALVAGEWL